MDRKKDVAKLQRKVGKWLKEWVVNPTLVRNFRDAPPALFNAYLDGDEDEAIMLGETAREFHVWHLVHFEHAVLNEGHNGLEDLALAVRYAEAHVRFEEAFADAGKGGDILLRNAAFYFSLAALAGQKASAWRIGKALVKGLDTSLLDLRHNERHCAGEVYRHFWFLMHLHEQFSGHRFDVRNYSYPPDMAPFANILENWQTSDLNQVHDWVCLLADWHLEQVHVSEDLNEGFDLETTMLFPYEILCWLRLREWSGLSNPATFDHPLMQTPLARLPSQPLPIPATPLLDRVIEKFRQEFPNSFS